MSLKWDTIRKANLLSEWLEKQLATTKYAISYDIIDGPHVHALTHSKSVFLPGIIGGEYSAIAGKYVDCESFCCAPKKIILQAQQEAVVADNSRFLAIVGGQRSGKSEAGLARVMRMIIAKPGTRCFIVVPSFAKVKTIIEKIDRSYSPFIKHRIASTYEFFFTNDSYIRFFSTFNDSQDSAAWLGQGNVDIIYLDEFREMHSKRERGNDRGKGIFESLYSRTIDKQGMIQIVSSPETGHFLEQIVSGKYTAVPFKLYHLSLLANPLMKLNADNPESEIEVARSLYHPRKFARNVLGEFVADEGIEFYTFDAAKHIHGPQGRNCTSQIWETEILLSKDKKFFKNPKLVEPKEEYHFDKCFALDFGHNLAMLEAVFLSDKMDPAEITLKDTRLHVIHEWLESEMQLSLFVDKILRPAHVGIHPSEVIIICDWNSGNQRDQIYHQTQINYLRKCGYRNIYGVDGKYRRKDTIDSTLDMFHQDRLSISDECHLTIESLKSMRYAGRSQTQISKDKNSHLTDCARYLAGYFFPSFTQQ